MILGIDTDVLIHWVMSGAPHHRAARRLLRFEVENHHRLGVVPHVLHEFLHVVTDARRFEEPFPVAEASAFVRRFWSAPFVERIEGVAPPDRVCELIDAFRLGRKRVLDTALAATLQIAGVKRLATFNARDFRTFPFLEVVDPLESVPRQGIPAAMPSI